MCSHICSSFFNRYGYTFCSRRPLCRGCEIDDFYDCDFDKRILSMSSGLGDKFRMSFFEDFKFSKHTNEWLSNDDFKKAERSFNKSKSYLYLTLSPDKLLRNLDNTEHNRKALYNWCNNWFSHNPKYYGDYCFVVECGSKGDHLHAHAVVELLSSHKHAEKLKASWAKTFPNNQLLTSLNLSSKKKGRGEYAYLRFDDELILQDKLDYFVDEMKGSHQNLEDLNLRGSRGFLTDKSKKP